MEMKSEILRALQDEFNRWEKLLSGLDEARIVARVLPSGLSIKDVVAHLMAWQLLSVARLEAAVNNSDPAYHLGPAGLDPDAEENLELINGWIHETYANEPWSVVYLRWKEGFQRLLALGSRIPAHVLLQPGRCEWLHGVPVSSVLVGWYEHHHDEHYLPLTAWLEQHANSR